MLCTMKLEQFVFQIYKFKLPCSPATTQNFAKKKRFLIYNIKNRCTLTQFEIYLFFDKSTFKNLCMLQTDQTHLHQFKLPILLIRTASYSWHGNLAAPRTTSRQVSWLIDLHALPSSRSPSEFWHAFPKYSDEFVQDSHLFPFSPDPAAVSFCLSDT